MKRVGLVAAGVALALGACGPPAGTDGDLTDGWPAMPAAQLVVPVAGACYADVYGYAYEPLVIASVHRKVVDCASADHDLETAFVGTFTGPDAAAPAPPSDGSPALRNAYATCEAEAGQYLGGDWQAALVWVSLTVPSTGEWRVGAHWFRCDLGHLASPAFAGLVHTGTVKDGLRGTRPLAITCVTTSESSTTGNIDSADPVACSAPHQAEFVGIYVAPDGPWPVADSGQHLARAGCQNAVFRYLGFANPADAYNPTIGYWNGGFTMRRWEIGDRSVRCFAYAYTKNGTFVGSVRGIRNTPARSR